MSTNPLITIDGSCGTGKGTVAALIAQIHSLNYLDSGAIYRAFALNIDINLLESSSYLIDYIKKSKVTFSFQQQKYIVTYNNKDVSREIRSESCGLKASIIANNSHVRELLLQKQRDFYCSPGLVADGRDMGTVVFPYAKYKFFLIANIEKRVLRRLNQYLQQNVKVAPSVIKNNILDRDSRDINRDISPLKAASDSVIIDTSEISANDVYKQIAKISGLI